MSSLKKVAVILGAGPGAGAGIAKAFSATHSVALLSRSQKTLDATKSSLPAAADSGTFIVDSSNASSITKAFADIKSAWPGKEIDVAVFNTNDGWAPGSFLERNVDDLRKNLEGGVLGAFTFSQEFLRQVPSTGGTLIFTGATMSLKGGAIFSTMAPSKFALRALSQSLAREFGPKGVHVAHVIMDGLIDGPRTVAMMGEAGEGVRLQPDDIGKAYVYLHEQSKSAWTQELDLRPAQEKW